MDQVFTKKVIFRSVFIIIILSILNPGCKEDKIKHEAIEGYITFFVGKVEITDNKKSINKASIKSKLLKGYKLKTYKNSAANVQIGSKVIIKLLADTELDFSEMVSDNKTILKLNTGKTYSKIIKKLSRNEKYKIKTPTVTASVRGTEFLTEYKNGKSNFSVKKGKIAIYKVKEGKDIKDTVKAIEEEEPDAIVQAGDYAVVVKKKEIDIKIEKINRIESLELEKISYSMEVIPEVEEKSVKEIKTIQKKIEKEKKQQQNIIIRKIQNVKNENNPKVILDLKDGSKLKGYIIMQDENIIKLDDGKDIMSISKKDIIRRSIVK